MVMKTYMIVYDQRGHSFRVPRPHLSVLIGTPNACNQRHRDRDARWATDTVGEWFPKGRQTISHFGTTLQAGQVGGAGRGNTTES
jgi:hypothetical protein